MGFERRVARKLKALDGKKPLNPMEALGEGIKQLPDMMHKFEEMREALVYAIGELNMASYENNKQRAVHLRMLRAATEPRTRILLPGARQEAAGLGIESLVELEEQFRAEYDAVVAFMQLADKVRATPNVEKDA